MERPSIPPPPSARALARDESDRRRLRAAFAAAFLAHGLLLAIHLSQEPPAPPVAPGDRAVFRVRPLRLRPSPRPPEPPIEDRPARRVPVPATAPPSEPVRPLAPRPSPSEPDLADLDVGVEMPAPPPSGAPEGPIMVGAGVRPPVAIFTPPPRYPEPARRSHVGGTVKVRAIIDRRGEVVDARILAGAPLGLSEAALAAVRRWRFEPATLRDRPVDVYFDLTVHFAVR